MYCQVVKLLRIVFSEWSAFEYVPYLGSTQSFLCLPQQLLNALPTLVVDVLRGPPQCTARTALKLGAADHLATVVAEYTRPPVVRGVCDVQENKKNACPHGGTRT